MENRIAITDQIQVSEVFYEEFNFFFFYCFFLSI